MGPPAFRCHVFYQIALLLFGAPILVSGNEERCQTIGINVFLGSCNFTRIPYLKSFTQFADLSYNYIQELNSTSFPLLEKMLVLYLGGQETKKLTIHKNSFRNLPNLITLDLSFNKILVLDQDAFAGLSKLETLLLTFNNLNSSILENDYFKDLLSLELLKLSFNQITYLKPNPLFYRLHNFKMLSLDDNKITRICEGDLHSFELKTFTFFDLSNNNLGWLDASEWNKCGNPYRKINFLTLAMSRTALNEKAMKSLSSALNGTKIQQLQLSNHLMGPGFGYQNLRDPDNSTFAGLVNSDLLVLNMSKGSIFSLKPYVFANLSSLLRLDLSTNRINRIEPNAFQGLHQLLFLHLSNNLLGEIYTNTFDGLTNMHKIYLNNNHIGPIQHDSFMKLLHLNLVDLRGNAIISVVFCESIKHLNFLNLRENKLKKIDSDPFKSDIIDLAENQLGDLGVLHKFLQITNLTAISLKQNRLSTCYPFHQIPTKNSLSYLDLSNNMIQLIWGNAQCLDVFRNLSALTDLHLSNNYLQFLPDGVFMGLTSLEHLNLSSNFLKHLMPGVFPRGLVTLDISYNQLLSPNPEVFFSVKSLSIGFNQFICDCTLINFLLWLNQTNTTVEDPPNIFCSYPENFMYTSLYTLTYEDCDDEILIRHLRFSLFVFTSIVLVTFLTSVIIYKYFRGVFFGLYKKLVFSVLEEKTQEENIHKYDAYLCYTQKDFQWVENVFLKNLDSEYCESNRFNLCFEERNFIPGEDHIVNIRDAIWSSKKTICIVTKQFLKDGWCVEAFNYAQSRYFTDLKDILIMVVVGSLSDYQLRQYKPIRTYIQRCQYLKWPEEYQDVDWFLGRLSHKILQKEKVDDKEVKVASISSTLELQQIVPVS
ncbi:PREDICTED: toll-like receptor 5 [Nanorana parkeri]|uniref:toll-like receptor 5 n=1 Tax=Nanorana parkeri TaxID=125878 RepID=UPI0008542190|nr:PREDICTED: toll-like receptor 5 [Nanorana parkeri]